MSSDQLKSFFQVVFAGQEGYLCLATRLLNGEFHEHFFEYPSELKAVITKVDKMLLHGDVYYCPHLLSEPKRVKTNVKECGALWADLDDCEPANLLVPPSVVVLSSPDRYQGLWLLEVPVLPENAEAVTKRIAYHHEGQGADTSGWDLTQLLRVPLTYNYKRVRYGEAESAVRVKVVGANPERKYKLSDFLEYPELSEREVAEDIPLPQGLDVSAERAADLLDEYKSYMNAKALDLYTKKPAGDWSRHLWELELILFEAGMSHDEVYAVCTTAACNKYARDDRPVHFLWQDVLRAERHVQARNAPVGELELASSIPGITPLLTDDERRWVQDNPGFIEKYTDWAKTIGDAAWQYHRAGAFVTLSSLLSGAVRLPTSFGTVVPNMWFMILADTTLTRKTTAMDLAMDMIIEIDSDAVLATDGSIEGLMTSLSHRPGRPSIFLRDEITGLIEMIAKKDYYAGMMETLTKLYDGKYQKRVLRKEIIEVKDPILVMFSGGIRDRMTQLVKYEHVVSGFLPRFIFVTAESDITKLKPIGPPTVQSTEQRDEIIGYLRNLHDHYNQSPQRVDGKIVMPVNSEVSLTQDAWLRYNLYEQRMLSSALQSTVKELMTPTMARLAVSGLKASVLLAAARQTEDRVLVEESDIIRAFYYIEQWREYSLEIVANVGKSSTEYQIDRVLSTIRRNPGITRSQIMQNHHLTAREADMLFATMEQRNLVNRSKSGRAERLSIPT